MHITSRTSKNAKTINKLTYSITYDTIPFQRRVSELRCQKYK